MGGKIPDPLPVEKYGEPTGGLDNTKIKGCVNSVLWWDRWLHPHSYSCGLVYVMVERGDTSRQPCERLTLRML